VRIQWRPESNGVRPPSTNAGPGGSARDLLRQAETAEKEGARDRAADLYEAVVRAASADAALSELLEALRARARIFHQNEEYEASGDTSRLLLEIAMRTGRTDAAGRAQNLLGALAYFEHRYDESRARYEEALTLAYEASDGVLIGMISMNMGVLGNITGDLMEARRCYLECVAAALHTEDVALMVRAYNNLGMVCTDLKEYAQAVLFFNRGIDLATRVGHDILLALLRANRAEPLICMQRLDAATDTLDESEQIARRVEDYAILTSIRRFRSAIARIEGDLELAEDYLDQALTLAEEHDLELERAQALGAFARIHNARGDGRRALAMLDEALAIFRRLGAARETRWLEEVRAEIEGGQE
jgi:tetratricopeptide (TPR) repeat protein